MARRFGANIFGRARNPLLHKPNPPGMHGARRKKKSDYGAQLEEQQKLKAAYGMLTLKKLLSYYNEAVRQEGNTAHVFIQQLECRLDNIVYRLKFAPSIFSAQQLVAHGHVLVDGKKVDIRSFQVQPGMTISIKPKSQSMSIIKHSLENTSHEVPGYLSLDPKAFSGKLEMLPEHDQIPLPMPINVPLVCEFLAHTH
ncbi:MAG TPA: 30S ribosomal protein S4 [Chlamydiales bacterium]|nr:30S ribosomal protein S4 [Chlamydiales bacterium]